MRIVFMGTPELARVSLAALLACPEFKVVGVVTQPDRPKGRDLKLQACPVKELAVQHQLPVLQPERARADDFVAALRASQPELIAVAAYGHILPKSILDLPPFGCLNVHTSLLPKYRGAAPIQWAILNDESETGVTIMKMDAGMDTGDILTQQRTAITADDTSVTLHDRLAEMGARLLVKTTLDYIAGKIQPLPQPSEGASLAPKIKKQDGKIDWGQPARVIWNKVRGLQPWPGAYTFLPGQNQLLKIWKAEVTAGAGEPGQVLAVDRHGTIVGCGTDALRLLILQREGGRRLAVREYVAGHPLTVGQRFT